jgi:hypothetical protein
LFVDLDAATLSPGDTVWANAGTYTDFESVGAPRIGMVETTPAVFFNGADDAFLGMDVAPAGLVGLDPTRSIEVWAINPSISDEETLVAWGHRGGPNGTNMSFNYGTNGMFGAVGHWGGEAPDLGWIDNDFTAGAPEANVWHHLVYTYDDTTTSVYSDGELWNSEDTAILWGSLDTYDNTAIAIAAQWNDDGSALNGALKGSLAIGRVRIHDEVLTDAQILANYNEEKDDFVNPAPPGPPTPEPLPTAPIHRYSFNNSSSNDASGAVITDSIGGADGAVLGDGSSLTGTQLRLDGGGSDFAAYVDLPNGLISGLTDLTVEGWITVEGNESWQRVFDFGSTIGGELDEPGGGGEGQDYIFLSASRGTEISQHRLELRNNDPDYGGNDPGNVGTTVNTLDTNVATELDEPYYFAAVYDSDGDFGSPVIREYRDGLLVGSQPASIELGNINDVNNWLGRSNWTVDANFAGTYDEFRMYDYALTDNQVLGNFEAGPEVINAPDVEPVLQPGDADQDYDFDQLDLVKVQIAAKFLTGQSATWGEGDWNGAPGGKQGDPPPGNGRFDQLDIIAALTADMYLKGPYAALQPGGQGDDDQASLLYDARTGEVAVDAPVGTKLTSINIESVAGIFIGDAAANLGGSFDNDADNNIFKATFGTSFGSLSFGNVAQPGLDEPFVLGDLSVVGSLEGGGALGDVDLIYVPVPEPAAILLLALGLGAWLRPRRLSR